MAAAWPACSDSTPGIRPGRVDHRHDREAEPIGQREDPPGLGVALWLRHAEVAEGALLEVAALLVADDRDRPPAERADAGDDRVIVGARAIAVQLDPFVDEVLDVVQRVRAPVVACELNGIPDVRLGGALGEAPAQAAERRGQTTVHAGPPFVWDGPCGARAQEAQDAGHDARRGCGLAVELHRHERAAGAQPQDATELVLQVGPLDHRVDEAVLEARLGAAEVLGQRLARRLLHDARTGEREQRVRLRDDEVAERRERRDHAAGRGMGQHGDVRHAGLAQEVDGARRSWPSA